MYGLDLVRLLAMSNCDANEGVVYRKSTVQEEPEKRLTCIIKPHAHSC